MRRNLENELINWKNGQDRYPLLIRGARQVGKSYLVEEFGKREFTNMVVVNFELKPQLKQCFEDLDPQEIINKLQLVLGVKIQSADTLIFLDEIQECPQAIMALRYFKEKMPLQAIIGAGSLLEFALRQEDFRMPVGRVKFLYLEPLSFGEFLTANGNNDLRLHLNGVRVPGGVDKTVHQKLLELLRLYLILGGMPGVLKEYFSSKNLVGSQNIQASLLQTFRADFGKYAKFSQQKYLQTIFDMAPKFTGQRVKYVNFDSEVRSKDLKGALDLLIMAGVIKAVLATSASGIPLGAQADEKRFKLNFLDVGLMQNACALQASLTVTKDILQINAGAVAEQFIGQELLACRLPYSERTLFFWARDKKNSSAEVDYVVEIDSKIYPIEVKSGKSGTLKSLKLFMGEKRTPTGIRFCQDNLSYHENVLSIPLYMVEQMPRLIKETI